MVSSDPRLIHRTLVAEEATCHSSTKYIEYGRQREYDASKGVTAEDPVETWYDRMDKLLMNLGFTESKVDSNLCFKVEGGILVMLLLCVNAKSEV